MVHSNILECNFPIDSIINTRYPLQSKARLSVLLTGSPNEIALFMCLLVIALDHVSGSSPGEISNLQRIMFMYILIKTLSTRWGVARL